MTDLEKLALVLITLALMFNVIAFSAPSSEPSLTDEDVQNGDAIYVRHSSNGYTYTRIAEAP